MVESETDVRDAGSYPSPPRTARSTAPDTFDSILPATFEIGGTQISTRSSGPDPSDQTSENPSEPVSLIEHYLRKWWEHLQRPSLVRRKLRELETACDNERPESRANLALEHYREFVIGFAKAGWTSEQSESICMLVCFARRTHIVHCSGDPGEDRKNVRARASWFPACHRIDVQL